MARPSKWPPTVRRRRGYEYIRIRDVEYHLGPAGSPEAKAKYVRLCAELAGGNGSNASGRAARAPAPAGAGLTVLEVVNDWRRHAEVLYAPGSGELEQLRLALQPLVRLYGDTAAADFGPVQLEELQLAMATGSWMTEADRDHPRRPKEGGWAATTVGRRIVKVRRVFAWAEKHGHVCRGTWSSLKTADRLPRHHPGVRHTRRRRPATLDQVKRVCRHLREPYRSMLLLLWWTGARPKEMRTLLAGEVDTTHPRCWRYRPQKHKTSHRGDVHTIAIGPRGIAVLRPFLVMAQAAGPATPVFALGRHPRSPRVSAHAFGNRVKQAARAAGLPGFSAYLNRHAAKMRIARLAGAEAARAVLGQRSIDTQAHYGEVDADLAAEVQRRHG